MTESRYALRKQIVLEQFRDRKQYYFVKVPFVYLIDKKDIESKLVQNRKLIELDKYYIYFKTEYLNYFFTNDINQIRERCKWRGYPLVKFEMFKPNPHLAKTVIDKMTELHCRFSMVCYKNRWIINFYKPERGAFICNLSDYF